MGECVRNNVTITPTTGRQPKVNTCTTIGLFITALTSSLNTTTISHKHRHRVNIMTEPQSQSNPTHQWYDARADEFIDRTQSLDVSHLYSPFTDLLPEGAHILDAGCGSGRDSLAFKQMGYTITALDASEKFVAHASELLGQPVHHMTFQQMDFDAVFDGIWAAASLLHVLRDEIDTVMARMVAALKPGGIFYASFKYGTREEVRDGRFFNDYNENTFHALIDRTPALDLIEMWTEEQKTASGVVMWLNGLARKQNED